MTTHAVVWFRRDLRLGDLPTLSAAAASADALVAVYVLDDTLLAAASPARRTFLYRCLRELDAQLGGRLLVTRGRAEEVIPALATEFGAGTVHISGEDTPYGRRRDRVVRTALGSVDLVETGSPYAVRPGRVTKGDGTPYQVFSHFRRAWLEHGWRRPADTGSAQLRWADPSGFAGRSSIPNDDPGIGSLPGAGEAAALRHWRDFRAHGLASYSQERDRPDLDSTSRMSVYLKYGCIHPRTMLHDLGADPSAAVYRDELAWREFFADVLHHNPASARRNVKAAFDSMEYDSGQDAETAFTAWCDGQTGYPIVDAGMRQLRAEGWMHNRVRMITASFLTKDLHLPWWRGARYFMSQLLDADVAANQHNWQWVAGTGTDAAPYFRIFNPTLQGKKFDPEGTYVRRWIPELREIAGAQVHTLPTGRPGGYPAPIVAHDEERRRALALFKALR